VCGRVVNRCEGESLRLGNMVGRLYAARPGGTLHGEGQSGIRRGRQGPVRKERFVVGSQACRMQIDRADVSPGRPGCLECTPAIPRVRVPSAFSDLLLGVVKVPEHLALQGQ